MRYLSKAKRFEAVQAYVLYFFFYSVLGWLYEVFLEVVVYRWGFTNRGVLLGPYCPVYGVGALVFLLCFSRLMAKREPSWIRWAKPVLVFLGCMITATAIELATSYILEALTGAWPWQTYLDYDINFEGRIALSPSIRFGLGGLLFLYVLQPLFQRLVGSLSSRVRLAASGAVVVLLAAECVLLLFDGSAGITQEDERLVQKVFGMDCRNVIFIINKCDLPDCGTAAEKLKNIAPENGGSISRISCRTGFGLDELKHRIAEAVGLSEGRAIVTNERHIECLSAACAELCEAAELFSKGGNAAEMLLPQTELVAESVGNALHCLGEISGREVSEELLDRIFERFCVGK